MPTFLTMKILFLSHSPHLYGASRSLLALIDGLMRQGGVKIDVIVSAAGPLRDELRKRGVGCWIVPFTYNTHPASVQETPEASKAKSVHVRAIVEIIGRTQPDLIYSNSSVIYYGAWAARMVRKPHVWHLREYGDLDYGLSLDFGRDYFRSLLRESAAVVTISRSIERHHLFGMEGVRRAMIYNGVAQLSECAIAPRRRTEQRSVRLVMLGVVQPLKGQHQAIEALSLVRKRIPSAILTIVGTGPSDYLNSLNHRIRELNLADAVTFAGYVADPLSWMRENADLLVMASENEAFGRVTAEAMTQGVPVVGRNSGGTPEIIEPGRNGLLYNGSPEDLAEKIVELGMDAEMYATMSGEAVTFARDRFTVEKYTNEVRGVLNGVLDSFATRAPKVTSKSPRQIQAEGCTDPFLSPSLTPENCDLYWVRSSILRALRQALPLMKGTFLDVGCGIMPYRDLILKNAPGITRYIGLDIETDIYKAEVDLRWDGKRMPLKDASVDCAMATEVLEHCAEPLAVLKEVRRVLRPGGVFFFSVPYLWPLHDAPHDFFRYTPFALEKLLEESGFENCRVQALGGWNASLAQMIGLWLKRAPMPDEVRCRMTQQLWPLYRELVKTDELPANPHAGNTMATGWSGIAFAACDGPVRDEVEPSDQEILIVRCYESKYSETFIDDHVNYLSRSAKLVYGYPFPRYVKGGECVISSLLENELAKISGRIVTQYDTSVMGRYVDEMADFLRTQNPSVVLLETGVIGAFCYRACEKAGIPYVVHFHGVDATGQEILDRWRGEYFNFFRGAAAIVVVSKAMREQLLALDAPADRIVLSPYGVSVAVAQFAEPETCPPVFIAVGRFVEKKGPQKTLEAFAKVHHAIPSSRLIMVGDGPLLRTCEQWALENGIGDAVTFTGVQSRAGVSRLMANSRVFVQHSLTAADGDTEGLPLAILEAGAHGLPVVATRHAGIPDAVEDETHGFLVREGDISGMADRMLRLASDSCLAARLGSAFRQRVVAEFSRHASITRLQHILARAPACEARWIARADLGA